MHTTFFHEATNPTGIVLKSEIMLLVYSGHLHNFIKIPIALQNNLRGFVGGKNKNKKESPTPTIFSAVTGSWKGIKHG